jgi:hypothetical protein
MVPVRRCVSHLSHARRPSAGHDAASNRGIPLSRAWRKLVRANHAIQCFDVRVHAISMGYKSIADCRNPLAGTSSCQASRE